MKKLFILSLCANLAPQQSYLAHQELQLSPETKKQYCAIFYIEKENEKENIIPIWYDKDAIPAKTLDQFGKYIQNLDNKVIDITYLPTTEGTTITYYFLKRPDHRENQHLFQVWNTQNAADTGRTLLSTQEKQERSKILKEAYISKTTILEKTITGTSTSSSSSQSVTAQTAENSESEEE